MKLAQLSVKRPIGVTMIMCVIIIFGIVSLYKLPVDLMPDITYPAITVSANYANYSIEKLTADDITKSKDAIILLNNYRWAYYETISRLLFSKQKAKARVLKNEMELKFKLNKLPYSFEKAGSYFEELFRKIDD